MHWKLPLKKLQQHMNQASNPIKNKGWKTFFLLDLYNFIKIPLSSSNLKSYIFAMEKFIKWFQSIQFCPFIHFLLRNAKSTTFSQLIRAVTCSNLGSPLKLLLCPPVTANNNLPTMICCEQFVDVALLFSVNLIPYHLSHLTCHLMSNPNWSVANQ